MTDPATDPTTHARSSDPETSHDAARRASYGDRFRVLGSYSRGAALTDHEAYQAAGLDWRGSRQRCSDLRALGWIAPTGETRSTPSGRSAAVCAITPAGRDAWTRRPPQPRMRASSPVSEPVVPSVPDAPERDELTFAVSWALLRSDQHAHTTGAGSIRDEDRRRAAAAVELLYRRYWPCRAPVTHERTEPGHCEKGAGHDGWHESTVKLRDEDRVVLLRWGRGGYVTADVDR